MLSPVTPEVLQSLVRSWRDLPSAPAPASRLISIWEMTQWILPMAPEHLRRVLAETPDLPQGVAGTEGGTRWFTPAEVAVLRGHFITHGRGARYRPRRPTGSKAPLVALTAPLGAAGRSTAALHLGTAAALAGYRVLLIDADPAGQLATALRVEAGDSGGVLGLIARAAGQHQLRLNEGRLDRGEAPLPMDETLSSALALTAGSLIRPTCWPGLDLMPAPAQLLQADLQIAGWQAVGRNWRPWGVLAAALDRDGLRQSYDLVLVDPGRGLGPLALAMLASADVLLAPVPVSAAGLAGLLAGLQGLAHRMDAVQAGEQIAARALGQAAPALPWRGLAVLPCRAGAGSAAVLAGFAAKLAGVLLPAALPEMVQIATGSVANFYDLDYRSIGRLAYAPQREACEAAWQGLAQIVAGLWAEDASGQAALALI